VLYPVRKGDKYGFIDGHGKLVVPTRFEIAGDMIGGLAQIALGGKVGFIDTSGAIAIEPRFDRARDFAGGLAAVMIGKKWGYVDPKGKLAIDAKLSGAWDFSEDHATVTDGKITQCIRKDGTVAFRCEGKSLGRFRGGLAPAEVKRKWRYVDTSGKTVLEPTCSAAAEYACGRAAHSREGKNRIHRRERRDGDRAALLAGVAVRG
jgi:hypothetical protein